MTGVEAAPATDQNDGATAKPVVEVVYYTDPLCCWSWAFEPQWRLLRFMFSGKIAWRYRMGGMLRNWDAYDDPVNAVHHPAQMGPLWLHAHRVSGMPIDTGIWAEERPTSSWPACVLVKAAERLSPLAADLVLRRLREAVMVERRNIAHADVLNELVDSCSALHPTAVDAKQLRREMAGEEARRDFMEDVKNARFRGIGRFPTLVIRRPGTVGRVLVGWHPFDLLQNVMTEVAPDLGIGRRPRTEEDYWEFWLRLMAPELELALKQMACDEPEAVFAGAIRQ